MPINVCSLVLTFLILISVAPNSTSANQTAVHVLNPPHCTIIRNSNKTVMDPACYYYDASIFHVCTFLSSNTIDLTLSAIC